MTLPHALQAAQTEPLKPPAAASGTAAGSGSSGRPVRAPGPAGRAARRLLRDGGQALRTRVRPLLVRFVDLQTQPVRQEIAAASQRVDLIEDRLTAFAEGDLSVELIKAEVRAATVNLELLKGEVRDVVHLIESVGQAIAPATGIEGAQVRMAELRERVNGLDRRMRQLAAPAAAPSAAAPGVAGSPDQPGDSSSAVVQSALFDYVGFERRFRGDPEEVLATLQDRYGALLASSPPVLDIGCGRAELLQLLRDQGVPASGVDTDPSMVAEARSRGLEVHLQDAVSYLRQCEPASLGAVIATHVVEHLPLDALIELLELAATRLKPGGILIAETPNPQSLIVLGNSYLLDPTHVRPLHPSLLSFLCEGAGFRGVELRFFAPATGYHLPLIQDPEAPAWVETVNAAFERLNHVLFGPQDFAVIATTPT